MIFYDLLNSQRKQRKPVMGELVQRTRDRANKPFGKSIFLDFERKKERNKLVRSSLEVEDIEGAKAKRIYQGIPKDIFKVAHIEGAHPHRPRRSPRSFAFDDYKDVTSSSPYRRPFLNSSQSIESQILSPRQANLGPHHK